MPWAVALADFKKDPSPILPILEQLKTDLSSYVRKSVANNINDISKTHPGLVVELAKYWLGNNKHTDWIIKHGCRTLLKKGNQEVLSLFGHSGGGMVEVDGFSLGAVPVSIGGNLVFSFSIEAKQSTKVRLEYGIDFVKATKKTSQKIFKISEISLKEGQKKDYIKSHSFADLSTRKHYPGIHSLALIVNGKQACAKT